MAVKKQPESDTSRVPSAALDWFHQFQKHLEMYFIDSSRQLTRDSTECEYQLAVMRAVKLTLSDSGLDDASILALLGQVAGETTKPIKGMGWTADLNQRRFELIDRDIQGTLTPIEQLELVRLTQQMRDQIDSEINLPLEGAKTLHRLLLDSGSTDAGQ